MLDKKKKNQIIAKFKTHANDTGSPEVQIAILTMEITELTEHLKTHKKDFSSRRGLIRKVNQRRKLLRYLEKTNEKSFDNMVKKLKIKITKRQMSSLEPSEEELEQIEETNTEETTNE
ncbi:MAG: 30S ribosomal protein S15 [Parcubacteria group bacterium CG1_02_37_51]|nr:MAG: 30S ribosomal protein S15 [Parcubacteria group bacterium CG1_02_37_51]